MACMESLESMSALLDGELGADESTQLERHMATCPACRQAFEAMTGVGSTLTTLEMPELPTDFARRAAGFVREHAFPQGPPPGPPAPKKRWFEQVFTGQHPILALVSARRRRPSLRPQDMLKVLAIFALPALFLGIFRDGMPLFNFLAVAGLGLMVAVPLYYFNNEIALMSSLIKGRCLEEVLGTSLEPTSTVDALAGNSLRSIFKACLPVVPVLLLGALTVPIGAETDSVMGMYPVKGLARPVTIALAALWLPLTLGLFLAGSYLALAWRIWARSPRLSVLGGLALAAGPAVVVLVGPGKAIPAFVLLVALYAVIARRLAIQGLERPEQVTRLNQTTRKAHRNRFLRLWSDNPITAREVWRVSGSLPGGLAGVFAWRLTLLVAPLLWAVWVTTRPVTEQSSAFWLGVAGFSFLLFVRAAYRTLGSVLTERQQQTWEPLLQTDLGAARFVRGWLEVAFHTVMLEGLLGATALTLFACIVPMQISTSGTADEAVRVGLLVIPTLLFMTLTGALLGMALSASCRSLNEASQRLALVSTVAVAGWLLLWGLALTGCYLLALGSSADTGSAYWDDFVQHDAPLASALAMALGLLLWSTSVLRREVTRLENQSAGATFKLRFHYPLTTLVVEASALTLVSYVSLVLTVLVSARFGNDQDDTIGLAMLMATLVLWWVLVRLPLATLAELARGSRRAIFVGLLLGALTGFTVLLLPGVLGYLSETNVIHKSSWLTENTWLYLSPVPLVLMLVGGLLGYLDARRAPSPRKARLGKRILISGTLSLAVLGGGYLWLQALARTPIDDPARVAEIFRRTEQRFERKQAVQPSENGYTSFEMLDDHPETLAALRALSHYDLGQKDEELARALLAARNEQQSFRAALPRVKAALSQPHFSFKQTLDPGQRLPDLILMRHISWSLAALGYVEELEGRLDEAVDTYLLGLTWGDRPTGEGSLLFEMIAVALETHPVERLLTMLSQRELSADQYRRIIARVERSRFRPEAIAEAVEAEMTMHYHLLERDREGRAQLDASFGLPLPESYLAYEKANLCNYYLEALAQLRRGRTPVATLPKGGLGVLAAMLVPSYGKAQEQMMLLMTRLEATRALAAIKLYQLEHGVPPTNLDQLVGPYLRSAPVAWIAPDHKFTYRAAPLELSCSNRPGSQERELDFYPYISQRNR